MNEKVKLPRNVIDTFRPALDSPHYKRLGSLTPIRIISDMYNRTLEGTANDVASWLNDYNNQWKLIDALHYGYEAELEPRWGIKAGNCYMENITERSFESIVNTSATLAEFDYFTDKAKADDLVKTLGFGEVVDLTKEGKADE